MHAHARALTYKWCIAKSAHAKHCTHRRTGRKFQTARVQWVHRAGYKHYVYRSDGTRRALCKHTYAHFYAESTPLGPYMLNTVYAHTHVLTTRGTRLGLHMPTTVHAHIKPYTYKGTPLGLHMPNTVPYAHPRQSGSQAQV